MELIHTADALHQRLTGKGRVAFVPTMGNLHEGHLQLVRLARQHGDIVVVSIFVNPLQFGPSEDFAAYPRTLEADCDKLRSAGCDVVFAPSVAEMYPEPQQITITPPPIANELCGAFRPGHFQGVATVVAKLFNLVQPQIAVFGKKDYQQLAVIRALVTQLNFPIQIVAAETARAEDGLALSSRNGYLSPAERSEAPRLAQTLQSIAKQVQAGGRDFAQMEQVAGAALRAHGWRVDYVTVRDARTLLAPAADGQAFVILAAAWLGKTRLIDNIEISINGVEQV